MPSLDKAFSNFLKSVRGKRTYADLADELGIAESTLFRLIHLHQSPTLRGVDRILRKLKVTPSEVFDDESYRNKSLRG